MPRTGMDPALAAGLQQAATGIVGTAHVASDAGIVLEELVDTLITTLTMTLGVGDRTQDEKRELIMSTLRQIGFDYSADKIRDYRPEAQED